MSKSIGDSNTAADRSRTTMDKAGKRKFQVRFEVLMAVTTKNTIV